MNEKIFKNETIYSDIILIISIYENDIMVLDT